MYRAFLILGLIVAVPLTAQEVPPEGGERNMFEVPVALDLPAAPVVLDLDNASLEVVLDAETPSVLRALRASEQGAADGAITVDSAAGPIVVRRAVMPEGAHGGAPAPGPRLLLELVLDPEGRLEIYGSDLDVVVEAPPEAETEDDGDDEDDDDEDDDEDD